MRIRSLTTAVAVACAAAIAGSISVSAHALPQSTVPAEGSSVQQAPQRVSIVFGQTPDVGLSSITVVNGSGTNVDAGPTTAASGNSLELQVSLQTPLTKGVYTVTWKTVSTVDGHLATGSFAFGVGVSATSVPHTAAVVGASPPSPLAVVARLLLFLGLIVVVGAVVLGAYAFGLPPPLLRTVIAGAAILVVLGTVGVAAAQGLSAGIGPAALLSSSLGRTLLTRAVPAGLLLVASLLLLRARGSGAALLTTFAGAAALASMAVDVLNSHAAAEGPAALNTFAQVLHIVAVGVWIGGVVALIVVLRRGDGEQHSHATRRLSTLAGYGIVVVAATGAFRAAIELQAWQNLVTTAFGVLVLMKIGLLIVLGGLGAINRYGNIPRLPRTMRRLRRVVTTEALVALGALTVAAALVNVAPPVDYGAAAASAPANIVVNGSDYAQTDKVSLTVTPGTSGFNLFDMRVTDYNSGSSVNPNKVVLQFTQPFRPELGTSTLTLARQQDGTYSAHGGNMSLAGIWEIAAVIENGLNSNEIHLQVTTIMPAPVVQVARFAGGLPTLRTITVTPQIHAQVYLDPNKPGADQWHCTWLDPNGNEIPMSDMTFGMTTPGGTPTILVKRRLDEIGHFVSDATVPAGTTRFDLIGTTVSGQTVSTFINITPGS